MKKKSGFARNAEGFSTVSTGFATEMNADFVAGGLFFCIFLIG